MRWPYAATVEVSGANYVAYNANGTQISGGTNPVTVINAAGAAAGYGTVFFRKGTYTLTATTPSIVPTAGNTFLGEGAPRARDSATLTAGSIIKGPASAMSIPVIDATDVEAFTMGFLGVDGNSQAAYCVRFGGFGSGASNCSFVKATTAAVYFSDGASSNHDAYADMFFGPNNWVHQNSTATKGVLVAHDAGSAGTARPTDGHIFGNNRIWGARSGLVHVTAGGWNVMDNRLVTDTSATLGAYFSSGHGAFCGNTLDSVGGTAHYLEIDGSSTVVDNNRFLPSSSGTSGAIIYVTSGNSLLITNNTIDGASGQAYTYGLDFASDPTAGTTNIYVDGLWSRQTAASTGLLHYTTGGGYTATHTGHHA